MRPATGFVLALWLASAATLPADTLITAKHHSDAVEMMGQTQPATDHNVLTWIAQGKTARIAPDLSVIVRADLDKMYLIRHADKAYSDINLPLDFKSMMPPEMAGMIDQMSKMMTWDATVTALGTTKTVAGFQAQGYKVAISGPMGMRIDQSLWTTKDLEIDYSAFRELMLSQRALMAPLGGDWWKKLSAIEGYPVLSESVTTMAGKSFGTREEMISFETKDAPAGTYDPPAGYKAEAFDPLGQGAKGRKR
jgi:Domain of unknown function (DUF4412)